MPHYRIVDLLTGITDPNAIIVSAPSPEKAAELALGVSLTRSGARQNLRARVYTQKGNEPMSMVRLYRRVDDQVPP